MEQTLASIEKIVTWYAQLPRDFSGVSDLMRARSMLATHLSFMAGFVADLNTQYKTAEFRRKAAFSESMRQHMAVDKTSAAAAKMLAENDTLAKLETETATECEYQRAKLLYDAWRNVCDTLSQHISNLKMEKNADLKNMGQ